MHLTRDQFAAWLDRYIEAWRSGDPADIAGLFSEDVSYSQSGGQTSLEGELDRSLKGRLKHLGRDERAALNAMLGASLNKMLHEPSVRLKEAAASQADEAEQLAAAISDLFDLQPTAEAPHARCDSGPPPPEPLEEAPSRRAESSRSGLDSGTG